MRLIINADDFGLSESITNGIVHAIKNGTVTSTTLITNTVASKYAILQAKENGLDCVGLHLTFTFGKPLTDCPTLCDSNGRFLKRFDQLANKNANPDEVYIEAKAQLEFALTRGLIITHIDSHHYVRENPIIQKAALKLAAEHNLPLRREGSADWKNFKSPDIFCKDFIGENVSEETLKKIIEKYKETAKTAELMCHVGFMDEYSLSITSYKQREKELETLFSAKRNKVFDGVELIGYKNL